MKNFTPINFFLTALTFENLFFKMYGQNYSEMLQLRTDLLQNYHQDIIPVLNQSTTMKVNITLYLYSILDVNGVKGSLTLPLMTMCTWTDEKLKWMPADYGGIEQIAFYQNEVWKPPVSLGTPVEFVIMQNNKMHVILMYNGLAMMSPGDIIESACTFNMKFWPFDKQICDVSFWSYDVTGKQVEFDIPEDGFKALARKNSEWLLESTQFFKREVGMMKEVVFRLYLKRQSGFYVLTILLPIIGLSILGTMVFLLPVDAGERVGFSITVMLSLSVFLTVLADEMPKTSEPMAIAAIHIVLQVVCGLLQTMIVILNMRLYHKKEKEKVHVWGKALVRATKCTICCNNGTEDEVHNDNTRKGKVQSFGNLKQGNHSAVSNKNVFIKVKPSSKNMDNDQDQETNEIIEWKDVSHAIDKISFFVFFSAAVLSATTFMAYMVSGSEYQEE